MNSCCWKPKCETLQRPIFIVYIPHQKTQGHYLWLSNSNLSSILSLLETLPTWSLLANACTALKLIIHLCVIFSSYFNILCIFVIACIIITLKPYPSLLDCKLHEAILVLYESLKLSHLVLPVGMSPIQEASVLKMPCPACLVISSLGAAC